MNCQCAADPCICEDAKTQAAWEMVKAWAECNAAAERKRKAEARYAPPPCDFEDE